MLCFQARSKRSGLYSDFPKCLIFGVLIFFMKQSVLSSEQKEFLKKMKNSDFCPFFMQGCIFGTKLG